mmetsp:Transcript_3423/g.6564  ORF Transcript_3423/g.6564 Transcript_3423/m.6564 type:complete len:104 (-) Transcript_3423:3063-3374(-)
MAQDIYNFSGSGPSLPDPTSPSGHQLTTQVHSCMPAIKLIGTDQTRTHKRLQKTDVNQIIKQPTAGNPLTTQKGHQADNSFSLCVADCQSLCTPHRNSGESYS